MTNEKEFLFWESSSRDTIDFKMVYVDIANGDLVSGLLLSQIIYWFLPSKSNQSKLTETNGVKQLIKKRGDWYNEIRISEKQYDRAVGILGKLGLIKVELKKSNYYDGAPVPHIQLNFDVLIDLLNNQREKSILTKGENQFPPKVEIDIPETAKTIDTETTPETISEIIKKEREEDFLPSSSENQNLTESKSNTIIETVSKLSSKLDRKKLSKEKYNLIKEIKASYDIEDFFKASIDNYKTLASVYTLIESNFVEDPHPSIIINAKTNLLEYLVESDSPKETQIYQELSQMDKGDRFLVYKVMLENFNKKYHDLGDEQKVILKTYVNNISNSPALKEFIDKKLISLKKSLIENSKRIEDKVVKIKVDEIINFINPILENKKMKDDYVISLLQYIELNEEISKL